MLQQTKIIIILCSQEIKKKNVSGNFSKKQIQLDIKELKASLCIKKFKMTARDQGYNTPQAIAQNVLLTYKAALRLILIKKKTIFFKTTTYLVQ